MPNKWIIIIRFNKISHKFNLKFNVLVADCEGFLEYFLKTYNNRPEIHFTSNMTNGNKRWLDIINKFKHASISMSIDGTGEIFEYLRPPGKWHIIKRNIKTMQEYQHVSLRLKFHVTIGLVAMLTVDDWLPYFLKNKTPAEFYPVQGIVGGQLTCIPKNYLKPVIKYLQKINHPYADEILRIIQNIGEYNPVHLNGFKDQTTDRDILLKRDIKLLSPSLHKLLT